MTEITVKRDGREITMLCNLVAGRTPRFDPRFGNWLPGEHDQFIFDVRTISIDGRTADEEQVNEVASDNKLMLEFECQLRREIEN